MMRHARNNSPRRGTVVVTVLWAIAMAAIIVSAVQLSAFRHVSLGREALQSTQARWAARSGVEQMIAAITEETKNPTPDDAKAILFAMQDVSVGYFEAANYEVGHFRDRFRWSFPMDEHAKMNVNRAEEGMFLILTDLREDVAQAILDWRDDDDDVRLLGVEKDYYLGLDPPYYPRNADFRTTSEIELVAGVWPESFRGEDWNLNQRLDLGEDDEARTYPVDDNDGLLDAGWSGSITGYSRANGATNSGLPRLQLKRATIEEIIERVGVDETQAKALIAFGRNPENQMFQLRSTPLNRIDMMGSVQGTTTNTAASLTQDQLRIVMDEFSIEHPGEFVSGRINLNTVSRELLTDLMDPTETDLDARAMAEEIIYMRDTQPEGIPHMLDLFAINGMTTETWTRMVEHFDTRSNVYSISSVGRSTVGGMEVEINVIVDRSTLPVRIIEYRED